MCRWRFVSGKEREEEESWNACLGRMPSVCTESLHLKKGLSGMRRPGDIVHS